MKIYLDMVGCRLNQSELEEIAREFTAEGHQLTANMMEADVAVVNTCTVTIAAAADSRKVIRRIARSGVEQIAVTGCWATMEPQHAAELPGVTFVVPNAEKHMLVSQLLSKKPGDQKHTPGTRRIPGARGRTRAFLKTQDGCSHQCAFCITTIARGPSRSIEMEKIIQQVQVLTSDGGKEVVLTGVQLGSWGRDLPESYELADLVEGILKKTSLLRLRLSSIEPWDITPRLISLLSSTRIARHMHLPLQSGSAETLKRMGRAISPSRYQHIISSIRKEVPEIALTTDIITGFPGETKAEFEESISFIKEMEYAGGHVFTYSARPGTPAEKLPNQVSHSTKKNRSAQVRMMLANSAERYRQQFIGKELLVLWENVRQAQNGSYIVRGMTDNYIRVETHTSAEVWNTITPTKLMELTDDGLTGIILSG